MISIFPSFEAREIGLSLGGQSKEPATTGRGGGVGEKGSIHRDH